MGKAPPQSNAGRNRYHGCLGAAGFQSGQLVLQLGTRWAGVEFELCTGAGIFPVPVVVDEYGVLTMDLGGSTTYTLSCIHSTAPIPDPEPEQTDPPAVPGPVPEAPVSPPERGAARRPSDSGSHLPGWSGRRSRSNRHAPYHKEAPGYAYDEWEYEEDDP